NTAAALERQVRAYQPWPGSFVETHAGRLVVWRAHIAPTPPTDGLTLSAADGALVLDEVQLAGGKRMTAEDLLRGRPDLQIVPSPATTAASG
ncbi:MAG TPA: hypothetical protein VMZ33_07495, partial [Candidatus Limnocylindrales bacterium]|nr:hypothetical protein [Candidatus Limnocylindrales bacterium]